MMDLIHDCQKTLFRRKWFLEQYFFDAFVMDFGRRKHQIIFAGISAVITTLFTIPTRFAPITHLTSSSGEIVIDSVPNISASATGKTSACYASLPKPAIVPDSQGRFDWRSVPGQHPVDSYTELPYGQPLSLLRVLAAFTKISIENVEKSSPRRIAVKKAFQ
jgi:mannosyl-oligosaccharide alpha-1,2-mannosidase